MRSVGLILLVCLVACSSSPLPERERQALAIETSHGSRRFAVELVSSANELWTGLRWRTKMAADHGMLFDLGGDQVARFTMSDTLLSLDMLFIDRNGRIVKIAERTEPGNPGPYSSDVPVRAVLELNAGTTDRLGIRPGDQIDHRLFRGRAAR